MVATIEAPAVDLNSLRQAIQDVYGLVANEPEHGFHFLVGRPLAQLLGYQEDWLSGIPEPTIASFAGTGNPISAGQLLPGERARAQPRLVRPTSISVRGSGNRCRLRTAGRRSGNRH
ncbi:MAG TPA: hypothetical protein VGL99_27065 [Chloroflexota bacterium]